MKTMPLHGTLTLSALRPATRVSARRRLITGCAVVGFATAFSAPALKLKRRTTQTVGSQVRRLRRRFLHPFFVDAFIGAIGEIGQLAVLYPLDTIKVRCQAQGASTSTVLAGVRSQGFNTANLKSLFAGCAPSAVCAALIGSCYLASFCAAKRIFARMTVAAGHSLALPLGTESAASLSQETNGGRERAQPEQHQPEEDSRIQEAEETHAANSAANDSAAALVASLLTSVLEAPVELFRHRMQAGLSHGKMLSNMAVSLSGEGLSSLYWGYAPFLLKGIPYDVAELFSYSQLTKSQERIPILSSLPVACRDCFIGAMAGAMAVLFSMPADCIKTRMELGATRPPSGLVRGSAAFFLTGRQMLAEKGLRSMFVGITPRLLENVPSTMFYWVLVAALRRTLEPFTLEDSGPVIAGAS